MKRITDKNLLVKLYLAKDNQFGSVFGILHYGLIYSDF